MMAKISGIIPPSPRVTNVDISNERPVRRGTPSFGAPIAPSSFDRGNYTDPFKVDIKSKPDFVAPQTVSSQDLALADTNQDESLQLLNSTSDLDNEAAVEYEQKGVKPLSIRA